MSATINILFGSCDFNVPTIKLYQIYEIHKKTTTDTRTYIIVYFQDFLFYSFRTSMYLFIRRKVGEVQKVSLCFYLSYFPPLTGKNSKRITWSIKSALVRLLKGIVTSHQVTLRVRVYYPRYTVYCQFYSPITGSYFIPVAIRGQL